MEKKYIIISHPRNGTGYAAKAFQSVGLDVGHEHLGKNGISSWMWATNAEQTPWGPPPQDIGEHTLIHIIRNPRAALASVAYVESSSEPFRKQHIHIPKEDRFTKATISLYNWHKLCQAKQPHYTIQTEQLHHLIHMLTGKQPTRITGYNACPHPSIPKNFQHPLLTALERLWNNSSLL